MKGELSLELTSESPNPKKETTNFLRVFQHFCSFRPWLSSPIRPFIDEFNASKEAMNPEEMSKLFQDIKEAKAAGKEIVYVSLVNNMTMLFLETSKK